MNSLQAGFPQQRLWEGSAPQSLGSLTRDIPHLDVFLPTFSGSPSPAVIICPGGGYTSLSLEYEGWSEAAWFQAHGIAAFVLNYRLPRDGYRHPIPLLDAQRAIRLVRAKAADFKIDPHKMGIMGFSSGGHLASTLETHFDLGTPTDSDPVGKESCRPDFGILVYPVISMLGGITNEATRVNLLGGTPNSALIQNLSNDTQVTKDTPPTYLLHTQDDQVVSMENSLLFYNALLNNGVTESFLKVYPGGEHGFGFGKTPDYSPHHWLEDVGAWMKTHGWMPENSVLNNSGTPPN